MNMLRKLLRESIPELADALERSWTIALDEWLAAIAPQKDSFNAYPHLRNHEKHLERIWQAHARYHEPGARPLLSPIEIYVMLSSILFHDIGRTRTGPDHGEASKVIIEKYRAALGIPSEALAKTIARICRFHDFPPHKMQKKLAELSTTSVDPFGEIREYACAALLTLIDYMDGTVTRVTPEYIRATREPVGAFRSVVHDVEIDFEGEMVKVVLGDEFETSRATSGQAPPPSWPITADFKRFTCKELADWLSHGSKQCPKWVPSLLHKKKAPGGDPARFDSWVAEQESVRVAGTVPKIPPGNMMLFNSLAGRAPLPAEQLVARQYARKGEDEVEPTFAVSWTNDDLERAASLVGPDRASGFKNDISSLWGLAPPADDLGQAFFKELWNRGKEMAKAARGSTEWPKELLLCMVLGNCRENAEVLREIRQTLWAIGIPVKAWVIQWKERIFNEYGEETYEPSLATETLRRTLDAMVNLATRCPRLGGIGYDTLAAEMGEMSVRKTKRAVYRVSIVLGRHEDPLVLLAEREWRISPGGSEKGTWLPKLDVLWNRLEKLQPPDVGRKSGGRTT